MGRGVQSGGDSSSEGFASGDGGGLETLEEGFELVRGSEEGALLNLRLALEAEVNGVNAGDGDCAGGFEARGGVAET